MEMFVCTDAEIMCLIKKKNEKKRYCADIIPTTILFLFPLLLFIVIVIIYSISRDVTLDTI